MVNFEWMPYLRKRIENEEEPRMDQTIAHMEKQLKILEEKSQYWNLKEINLLDQIALAIREKGETDDQIHDLVKTITQLKCSESPRSWFFRNSTR